MSRNQVLLPLVFNDKAWNHYFYDPKTKIIYYEARIDGKRIKFSTKEINPLKAKLIVNRELKERLGLTKQYVRNLISAELDSWVLFKESEGHKYDTLNNIRRAKKQIGEYWGDKLPSDITRDSFADWCAWWKENNPEIQMENAIKYFNNFCRYLHEKIVNSRSLLPALLHFKDPSRHLVKAKRAKKKENIFSAEEIKKILLASPGDVERIIVLFMLTMATRIDETLKLEFDSRILMSNEPPLYRWNTDTNKARLTGEQYLHKSLIEPLVDLRIQRRAEGTKLLFPQKTDNLKPLREQMIDWGAWRNRADIGWHWTPHTFRHTCLSYLFNNASNPQAIICKQYRVSMAVALETYIKVTKESMLAIKDSIEVSL